MVKEKKTRRWSMKDFSEGIINFRKYVFTTKNNNKFNLLNFHFTLANIPNNLI